MKLVSKRELETGCIEQLGLDPTAADLTTPEALAELFRRIASLYCPCSPSKLVSVALELIEPLQTPDITRELLWDTVEALTAYGDLVESDDVTGQSRMRVIYLAPPAYVEVTNDLFLLIGGSPDGQYPLPEEFKLQVEPVTHYRRLRARDRLQTAEALLEAGFLPVKADAWLKAPTQQPSATHLSLYNSALDEVGPPGTIEEMIVLESSLPVTYYRGRWKRLKKQNGRFVARRPQAYGADLWCYAEISDGLVTRLLDLPHRELRWRACDEAWHLQQAIDSALNKPQVYRVRSGPTVSSVVVELFSPLPLWAIRKWDYVGTRALGSGCLFAYVFDASDLERELEFARERMWLRQQ
jgi:hypothetical protein